VQPVAKTIGCLGLLWYGYRMDGDKGIHLDRSTRAGTLRQEAGRSMQEWKFSRN
jgi:hypothetical protein